jgi:hypothetical protein
MSLFQESGQSPARRNEEALQLVRLLYSGFDGHCDDDFIPRDERQFLSSMFRMYEKYNNKAVFVTAKQLFWLRDLEEKYL